MDKSPLQEALKEREAKAGCCKTYHLTETASPRMAHPEGNGLLRTYLTIGRFAAETAKKHLELIRKRAEPIFETKMPQIYVSPPDAE